MPSDQSTWLISIPEDGASGNVSGDLYLKFEQENKVATVSPVNIPPFKTGTLDTLISLSDELPKTDSYITSVVARIVDTLRSLLNDDQAKLLQHIRVNESSIDDYLMKDWRWNDARYGLSKGLQEIAGTLNKEIVSIDNMMKSKVNGYNSAKSTLTQMQRKKTGNLSVRSLVDVVSRDDFIIDSEYMETVLVAVPKNNVKSWQAKYERLSPMVIPRSSSLVSADDEYSLFSVVIFRRSKDEFLQRCRENQFTVREFAFSEDQVVKQRQDLDLADTTEKELWVELLRISRTNFSEAFQGLVHLKVLRLFVESVLRYGLPANYTGLVVKPGAKSSSKTLSILTRYLSYLPSQKDREKKLSGKADTLTETTGEYQYYMEQELLDFVLFEVPWIVT